MPERHPFSPCASFHTNFLPNPPAFHSGRPRGALRFIYYTRLPNAFQHSLFTFVPPLSVSTFPNPPIPLHSPSAIPPQFPPSKFLELTARYPGSLMESGFLVPSGCMKSDFHSFLRFRCVQGVGEGVFYPVGLVFSYLRVRIYDRSKSRLWRWVL